MSAGDTLSETARWLEVGVTLNTKKSVISDALVLDSDLVLVLTLDLVSVLVPVVPVCVPSCHSPLLAVGSPYPNCETYHDGNGLRLS